MAIFLDLVTEPCFREHWRNCQYNTCILLKTQFLTNRKKKTVDFQTCQKKASSVHLYVRNVKMCNRIINTYCLLKMYQQLSNHYSLDLLFGNFSLSYVAEGRVLGQMITFKTHAVITMSPSKNCVHGDVFHLECTELVEGQPFNLRRRKQR